MDWLNPYFDSNKPLANCNYNCIKCHFVPLCPMSFRLPNRLLGTTGTNYNYIERMAKPSNC